MKKLSIFLIASILAIVMGNNVYSQAKEQKEVSVDNMLCCHEKTYFGIDNLTDEQKKKIDKLQIEHLKEVNKTRTLLKEKQAHLHTLQVADKPDNNEINKTIDEITSIKNDLMKKHEAYRQSVRALLTDEQKVIFDAKRGCQGMHNHKHEGCCRGNKDM